MKNKHFTLSMLFLFILLEVHAQQSHLATGGNATGTGGSAAYSVGQLVYTVNSGVNGTVAQGVQQPFEISVVTGIAEAADINLQLKVYPNPTKNFLNLIVEDYSNEHLTYQLFDINGKIVLNKTVSGQTTTIPTEFLKPATYFLKVFDESKALKTFKIIKN